MSLEKISNQIKTQLQTVSESAKKITQISIITAWLLTGNGCSEVKQEIQKDLHASVEKIPYTKKSPFSLIKVLTNNRGWHCNIFRFEYQNKTYSGSAKHCFQNTKWQKHSDDIIILPDFKQNERIIVNNSKQQPIQSIEMELKYNSPRILEISPLSYDEIQNNIISIEWIYPDNSWDTAYKISGKPIYHKETWVFLLIINNNDFNEIMKHNTRNTRYGLNWMSGSPVLDSEWRIIGTLIAWYNWNDKNMKKTFSDMILHNWIDSGNMLIFNPIRKQNGQLKSHALTSSEIQSKNINKQQEQKKQYLVSLEEKEFLLRYNLYAQYYIKSPTWRIYFGTNILTWERKSIHIKFKRKKEEI